MDENGVWDDVSPHMLEHVRQLYLIANSSNILRAIITLDMPAAGHNAALYSIHVWIN